MLKWVRGDENDIRGENTQLAQGARAIPLVFGFGFGFGLYWIGLDYSRTLPRFAAICRNLPQTVLRGFGVLGFAVSYSLMLAPIWEIKVGPPVYLVEGDAAFIRQRAKGTSNVFNCQPFPKRENAAFNHGRAGISAPCIVSLSNQSYPKPELKI